MTRSPGLTALLIAASIIVTSAVPEPAPANGPFAGIQNVFVIVMENHDWADLKGNPAAPYINSLLSRGAHAEQYTNPPGVHPSLPNYLWLEAGQDFGIRDDNPPAVHSQTTTAHLTTLLDGAGISWKTYQEGIGGTTCPLTSSGQYAVKHNPFVYFADVTGGNNPASAYCVAHVRPYTELAGDLQGNATARYNFITPDICHDMHDCSIEVGDTWLSTEVPKILASAAFQRGVLFITFDESEHGDAPIAMIVLSPRAKPGYDNAIPYTHSSTLRTIQEIFGVTPLLGDARNATSLADLFSTLAPGGDRGRATDYDSDGRAEITVYNTASGVWSSLLSSGAYATATNIGWGGTGYTAVPGDYDGDGKADLAVYYQASGNWYVLRSSTGFTTSLAVNVGGADWTPAPGDYDGDGKTDFVVYNGATGQWYGLKSSANYTTSLSIFCGGAGYVSVPADYDGDGRADIAVYRSATGAWSVLLSSANYTTGLSRSVGGSGWSPVQADYDGDGKADFAVYNAASGRWFALKSSTGYTTTLSIGWGGTAYTPVQGDYDGDGRSDLAVYQQSSGTWYILLSGANYTTSLSRSWGGPGYAAVPQYR